MHKGKEQLTVDYTSILDLVQTLYLQSLSVLLFYTRCILKGLSH